MAFTSRSRSRRLRRGVSMAQWAVLAAILCLGIVAAVKSLGTKASTDLNSTANQVADPVSLKARFSGS